MNWYIGQKIICVKSHSEGAVKKGQIFTIKGTSSTNCSCNVILLDVGVKSRFRLGESVACARCFSRYINSGAWWLNECLFAPIQDEEIGNTTAEAILEEIEYHELQEA